MTYDKGLNNLSYTNKDFNAIYSELLDLTDKLALRWKPSISDESDPGVLLLKLDALMADKANYNIDKNILELFPSSVTQYANGREIFEQCGYSMKYYQAAEVELSLNVKNRKNIYVSASKISEDDYTTELDTNARYRFDSFTMVANQDNTVVYTIPESFDLSSSQQPSYVKAFQGVINTYTINNSSLISYDQLDPNNRLYFSEKNVAENGIFILSPSNAFAYTDWDKVDNLYMQPLNTYCYKFGISRENDRCYIEFPSDIANLIGDGLIIKYILTDGYNGNISEKVLSKFYIDTKAKLITAPTASAYSELSAELEFDVNGADVYITNMKPSQDGADPETLAEARVNYEKVKNTFNTLVSLQDYNNFLKVSKECSNGFFCDRTNDIQHAYKIISSDGWEESINMVNAATDSAPALTAFDLRLYATRYANPVTSAESFDVTFEPINSGRLANILSDLEDTKSIQHDIKLPDSSKIIGIYLDYPIVAKIVPYVKLTIDQELEIIDKVCKALYKNLNASKLNYGEEVDYDLVYDTILTADSRIKSLILHELEYTPKIIIRASTQDKASYEILKLTDTKAEPYIQEIKAKCVLAGVTPLYKAADSFNYAINHKLNRYIDNVTTATTSLTLYPTLNSSNKASITLLDNENIYLTTPNYITKETYSNYTKYFYNFKLEDIESIVADGVVRIPTDGYIAFFWKTSSDDNAPYRYKIYHSGDMISPNFTLTSTAVSSNVYTFNNISAQGKYSDALESYLNTLAAATESSGTVQGYINLNNITETLDISTNNELITKCSVKSILDGTKAVSIKAENKVTLSATPILDDSNKLEQIALPYAYWVVNNKTKNSKDEDTYTIVFNKIGSTNNYAYTLQSGEQLFYTDSTKQMFATVGHGTKIILACAQNNSVTSISLQVTAIPYGDLLVEGVDILNSYDLWYNLGNNTYIKAIELHEMEFYNLSKGATLYITPTSDIDFDSINISAQGINALKNNKLVEDFKYSLSYEYDGYISQLPQRDPGKWEVSTRLDLNLDSANPQYLPADTTREHRITFKSNSTDEISNIGSTSDIAIQSNYAISKIGGTDINLQKYNIFGNLENASFYIYSADDMQGDFAYTILDTPSSSTSSSDSDSSSDSGSSSDSTSDSIPASDPDSSSDSSSTSTSDSTSDSTSASDSSSASTSATIKAILDPTSIYLVPILTKVPYTSLNVSIKSCISDPDSTPDSDPDSTPNLDSTSTSDSSSDSSSDSESISDSDSSSSSDSGSSLTPLKYRQASNPGLFFFEITQQSEIELTISWEKIPTTSPAIIRVLPLLRVKSIDEDIKKAVIKLDNGTFNYAHRIIEADELEPLSPEGLLNPLHPYNRCVLCRWAHDEDNTRITVSNKVK